MQKITWLLIAVVSLSPIGLHAQSGAVICIESDGHFTIELAVGTRCASDSEVAAERVDENPSEERHEHVSDGETHCADCIDIAISKGSDEDCQAVGPTPAAAPKIDLRVVENLLPTQNTGSISYLIPERAPESNSDPLSILSKVIFLT